MLRSILCVSSTIAHYLAICGPKRWPHILGLLYLGSYPTCVEGPNSEPSRIPGDNLGIVGLGRNRLALSDDLIVSETIGRLPKRKLPRSFRIRQEQEGVSDDLNVIGIVQALLREP